MVPSVIVDREFATAGAAGGQALQQRAALPDGPGAGLVRGGADVPPDPLLVGQVVVPAGARSDPLGRDGPRDNSLWVDSKLCVIDGCSSQAVAETQFCKRHPNGAAWAETDGLGG